MIVSPTRQFFLMNETAVTNQLTSIYVALWCVSSSTTLTIFMNESGVHYLLVLHSHCDVMHFLTHLINLAR